MPAPRVPRASPRVTSGRSVVLINPPVGGCVAFPPLGLVGGRRLHPAPPLFREFNPYRLLSLRFLGGHIDIQIGANTKRPTVRVKPPDLPLSESKCLNTAGTTRTSHSESSTTSGGSLT